MKEMVASNADAVSNFKIKDSGISMSTITDWKAEIENLTTELTEEENRSKFAKYYYRGLKMPAKESVIAAEQGSFMPEEFRFMPDEYLKCIDSPRGNEIPTGGCILDNGIGFSVSRIEMPDITDEMFVEYNKYYQPENDIFYKSWCPGFHIRHYIEGCAEDVGLGMELIKFMCFGGADEFAGEPYQLKDKDTISFHALSGISWPLHNLFNNNERYALEAMAHRRHPNGKGRISYVAFWHGLKLQDGKVVRAIPEDKVISMETVRAQMYHACLEFSQVPSLVKAVCEDIKRGYFDEK